MEYEVFISYKSQYVDIVKAICHVLESENIRCWYAPRDLDKNSAGYDYDDSILRAISNCKIVVAILTDEALDSEWVKIEISQAQKKGKIIIPYVVNEITKENGLLMRLQNKHWIDAYPNPERRFFLLLNNVKLLLNETLKIGKTGKKEIYQINNIDNLDFDFDYEEGKVLYEAKEYDEAVAALSVSAERGNQKASALICLLFYDLKNQLDKISSETWNILDRQAKAGYGYACFAMHTKYYNDYENYYISFDYLKKAVRDKTLGLAFLRLGIHYGWGMGVKPNHTLSMYYYRKAIELGCIQAYSYIGQEMENGSDKCLPNIDEAMKYYRIGADKNDERAIMHLASCYINERNAKKDKQEALRLYKKAVDLGYYSAYCRMGNYFQIEGDIERATKYYKMAAEHDEEEAFGDLALIYWNKMEFPEAYRWANSGYNRKNAYCAFVLGFFYEQDKKYKKAWDCYFARYKWAGVGAESMAHLYLDEEYRPEGVTLNDIIGMLDVSARNNNEEAIDFLIKIYTDDAYACKDLIKAYEYTKLGAIIGISNKMYEYGLSFMGDKVEIFNAYKGLEWIEKAAKKEYIPAIEYLLKAYSGDKYEDEEKLVEWSRIAVNLHLDAEPIYSLICRVLIKIKAKDELKQYLIHIIEDHGTNTIQALGTLFTQYFEGLIKLNDEEYNLYSKDVFSYITKVKNETILPLQRIIHKLDSSFSPSKVEEEQITEGELFEKYYKYYWAASFNLFEIEKKDGILHKLFAPIQNDASFEEAKKRLVSDVTGVSTFWNASNDIFDLYETLCQRYSIAPVEYKRIENKQLYPFISSCLADSYGKDIVKCFISICQSRQEDIVKCKQPSSFTDILNVAEKCADNVVQSFLITLVDAHIEIDTILSANNDIYTLYVDNNMSVLSQKLDEYKERMNKLGITHTLPDFNKDYVYDLMHEEKEEKEKDEFDRLLDEFILSNIN